MPPAAVPLQTDVKRRCMGGIAMLSRRTNGSTRRQHAGLAGGWHKRLSGACGRHIAFETLEDRSLLSAGAVQSATLGEAALIAHSLAPVELVSLAASIASATAAATSSTGPTISQVVIPQTAGTMSWSVSGPTPVATSTLVIDGTTVSGVTGPVANSSGGVTFSASINSLATGVHSYIITATDTVGNTSTSTSTFKFTNGVSSTPTIGSIVVSQSSGRVSWNVLDSTAITVSTLVIDGTSIPYVLGPFTATSGVNFSGPLTLLAAGDHTLTITATDKANATASVTQTFTIAPTGPGPVISSVVVDPSTATITWNAADASGVTGSTLTIDGVAITPVGPVGTPTSADFHASLGLLNAGVHTVTITATNTLNVPSTLNANFILDSQTSVGPTVSQVVVSESKARISWNAVDTTGVTSSTLSIDGNVVSSVAGPFTAGSGVNFSAPLNSLAAGSHSYTITAFDGIGSKGTASGVFTLSTTTTFDPMIGSVVISQLRGRISWNVFSPNTISRSTLQIDGVTIGSVIGPFAASSGVNFSASLAGLAAGNHTYRITATDTLGRQSAVLANFSVTAAVGSAVRATQNAVFSGLGGSAAANSAKVDWTLDLGGVA
jgi:large repetitive protein